MARPERGRRGPPYLELDCDLESEGGRGLGNYKTFKRVPRGLANISTEIMSGQNLRAASFSKSLAPTKPSLKPLERVCPNPPNSGPAKTSQTHFNHKTILRQTRSFTGTDLKAVARQEEWRRDASRQSRCEAVWILHITASHLVQHCTIVETR